MTIIGQYCYFCPMYYSYVIYNLEHHRFYFGITVDLKQTEKAHNDGLIEETRNITPWNLVYQEEWKSKNDAIRRIRFYRTIGGQRHLKRVLNF
ncbi:MAG: GIY-YIG nuclease family protein [Mangrovibacterium sp.]